ncbi:hypothetical protein KBY95_07000 [Cyanobium sp. Aljojuca 7A6]|nr:hypothetical protein [Cyanobium sp. La Preciosa 7G6]MCP9936828.1 hypothetical protein [Cyanobium sp. Aljojuca 7A6]
MGLIRVKLATTQRSAMALTVLVMNFDKLLGLLFVLLACWLKLLLAHRAACNSHVAVLNDQPATA